MKITKNVELFDSNQFKKDKIYYIRLWEGDGHFEGLFLCEFSFGDTNAVELKRVLNLSGECPYKLRFDNKNYQTIDTVCEVNFMSEYDTSIKEWYIYANISLEEQ